MLSGSSINGSAMEPDLAVPTICIVLLWPMFAPMPNPVC